MKLKHCSHELGVLPEWQSRGVGYALKVAQREAVRDQGLRLITWTYDPLESKNANLNIAKLGAVCNTYLRDHYGELHDELNQGLATDRFQVDWWIASQRVDTCLAERRAPLRLRQYLDAGILILNPVKWNDRDLPMCTEPINPLPPDRFLAEFPVDFQAIKRADKALAITWRLQLRHICETAFAAGFTAIDYVHEPGPRPRSFYALQRIEANESNLNA